MRDYLPGDFADKILSAFAAATGLRAIVVDNSGHPQIPRAFRGDCLFCQIVQNNPEGRQKCYGAYSRAGEQAAQFGEPYIFRCHAGLIAIASPLFLGDEHIGSVICNQILMWQVDEFFREEIREMTAGLKVEQDALLAAAEKIEISSGRKVQAAADLLFLVSSQLMQGAQRKEAERKDIAACQAEIGEVLRERKKRDRRQNPPGRVYGHYSLQKEKALAGMVSLGDREGARKLLNELVSEITEKYLSKPPILKARILELLVVLSRAAVEGGAEQAEIFGLNNEYMTEISQCEKIDRLCAWIFKVFDDFMDRMHRSHSYAVEAARRFIRENYDKDLTLKEIAEAVYVSPCHLSHIFKEKYNCTVLDYLRKVRIEEAKRLLGDPRLTIDNIARSVGYNDAGYFSRIFKKSEGVTPTHYRIMLLHSGKLPGGEEDGACFSTAWL